MEYSPPPLFKQGASARVKVAIYTLMAFGLLVVDARERSLTMLPPSGRRRVESAASGRVAAARRGVRGCRLFFPGFDAAKGKPQSQAPAGSQCAGIAAGAAADG